MASHTRSRGASSSQVVRNRYSAKSASVSGRRLAVAELRTRPFDDLGEADHGDRVVLADGPRIDLLEEVHGLVATAELRVVVLDVARRELLDPLDLDVVDHRGEDLLARLVAIADRDPDH